MTQDNSLLSKLADDQRQLEENIDLSNPGSRILPSKLSRRVSYHQSRRTLWLTIIIITSMVITYPVTKPLFSAAFLGGNVVALTLICFFIASILLIMITEKLDGD